ncbi:hypothetical protein DFH06DRAFT_1139012 [Mycena polygramma]|nr:hypothetical protein DFH06DRAFT_1139012 [Mycena polygramma]
MGDVSTQTAYEFADRHRRLHNCLHLLGIGLMYFDHLITLATSALTAPDDEISFLWKRAGSASAYWFFAVRYAGFAGNIPVTVFTFYTMPPKVVLVGAQLLVSSTSPPSPAVARLTSPASCDVPARTRTVPADPADPYTARCSRASPPRCRTVVDAGPGLYPDRRLSRVPCPHYAVDCIPLSCSLGSPLRIRRTHFRAPAREDLRGVGERTFADPYGDAQGRRTVFRVRFRKFGVRVPVLTVGMLRSAIALVNLLNILTFYLAGPILAGSLSTFASCMSVTLMARLMLNLHKKAGDGVLTDLHLSFADDDHEQSEIVFAQPRVSVASGTRARTQWGDSGLGLGMSMSMGMRRGDSVRVGCGDDDTVVYYNSQNTRRYRAVHALTRNVRNGMMLIGGRKEGRNLTERTRLGKSIAFLVELSLMVPGSIRLGLQSLGRASLSESYVHIRCCLIPGLEIPPPQLRRKLLRSCVHLRDDHLVRDGLRYGELHPTIIWTRVRNMSANLREKERRTGRIHGVYVWLNLTFVDVWRRYCGNQAIRVRAVSGRSEKELGEALERFVGDVIRGGIEASVARK